MFNNLLVGVDGGQGGRDAIELARRLARPGARLSLGHIYRSFAGRGASEALSLEREESEQLLERERERASIDARLVVHGDRPVGRGLHELAEEGADLLVVGSSRRALLGRALLGDDTRASLDGAPCAVAVAPRGYAQAPRELRILGVGYDGGPESECALAAARELAQLHGAVVKVLWVVSLQDVRDERPLPADWPQTADLLVDRCRAELRPYQDLEADAVYGGPREELQRLSERVNLLLVGSRSYGPVGRLFHGSVSGYLLGHVGCPLLILPPSAGARGDTQATRRTETAVPLSL